MKPKVFPGLIAALLGAAAIGAWLHLRARLPEPPEHPAAAATPPPHAATATRPQPHRPAAHSPPPATAAAPPAVRRPAADLDRHLERLMTQGQTAPVPDPDTPVFKSVREARSALSAALSDVEEGDRNLQRMEQEFFLLGGNIGPDGTYSFDEQTAPPDQLERLQVLQGTLTAETRMQQNRRERLRGTEQTILHSALR